MNYTIRQYALDWESSSVLMPARGKILNVSTEEGEPCIYALIDQDVLTVERRFRIFASDESIEDPFVLEFVGDLFFRGHFYFLFEERPG